MHLTQIPGERTREEETPQKTGPHKTRTPVVGMTLGAGMTLEAVMMEELPATATPTETATATG